MSLKIASNNAPTYDYYSEGDGTDPARVVAFVDGEGGTVDSGVLTAYLVATSFSYTGITVQPSAEDSGVDWKVSLDGETWADSVTPSDMDATAADVVTTLYFKAVVDNDGSIGASVLTGCDIDVSYDESPE